MEQEQEEKEEQVLEEEEEEEEGECIFQDRQFPNISRGSSQL